jgi:hypothetical protein
MHNPIGKALLGSTPPGRVHYWLPSADGGNCRFDVPASLAKCIGRYARIPEFVAHSHLLAHAAVPSVEGD